MNEPELDRILEAVLFAADEPLSIKQLQGLFPEDSDPGREAIRDALTRIAGECEGRSIELKEVGSGWRFQVRESFAQWVSRLWEEKPARYSRATLETLALIAYRQPITRGEIEEVRGVSVSSQIIKSLMERDWIKVVGHRDVPGKPALYATTRAFLDYFNLKSLQELPPLSELRDIDAINAELELGEPGEEGADSEPAMEDDAANSEAETESTAEEAAPEAVVDAAGTTIETESEPATADETAEAGDDAAGSDAPAHAPSGAETGGDEESRQDAPLTAES